MYTQSNWECVLNLLKPVQRAIVIIQGTASPPIIHKQLMCQVFSNNWHHSSRLSKKLGSTLNRSHPRPGIWRFITLSRLRTNGLVWRSLVSFAPIILYRDSQPLLPNSQSCFDYIRLSTPLKSWDPFPNLYSNNGFVY